MFENHGRKMKDKNCSTCKHAGWDPDGNYCAAPEVLKRWPYGLNIPQRTYHKNWQYGIENYCEPNSFVLYEEKK